MYMSSLSLIQTFRLLHIIVSIFSRTVQTKYPSSLLTYCKHLLLSATRSVYYKFEHILSDWDLTLQLLFQNRMNKTKHRFKELSRKRENFVFQALAAPGHWWCLLPFSLLSIAVMNLKQKCPLWPTLIWIFFSQHQHHLLLVSFAQTGHHHKVSKLGCDYEIDYVTQAFQSFPFDQLLACIIYKYQFFSLQKLMRVQNDNG